MDFAASSRKAGEAEMERLVAAYGTAVKRMCLLYLHDLSLAEDAAQETFLKAWRAYDTFRGDASEKTWLMRIAINTCRDMQRTGWFRHMDRRVTPDDLPSGSVQFPQESSLVNEVMALPRRYREVVLLHYYQGLSLAETAAVLGSNINTVKSRLMRARKMLKTQLEGGGEDERP